jgi:predicted transcriptional regulator of viral defense system
MAASRLVRKGVLDRVRPGLFTVRPFRAVARPWAPPALVAVELLLAGEPHYVGGLAAFTLHRLTMQQHTSLIDVFTPGYRRPRRLGSAEVRFHRRRPAVFETGIGSVEVDGVAVAISDPARTVVDALEEFRVVGGMPEAVRLFHEALPRLEPTAVVEQALAIARDSTCQRLGLLLDRAGLRGPWRQRLVDRATASTGVHRLIPGGGHRDGPVHLIWHVIENDCVGSAA